MTPPITDFCKNYLRAQGVEMLPPRTARTQQPGKIVEAGSKESQGFSLRGLK